MLTEKTYQDEEGRTIKEYRNTKGELHNPDGPAVVGGVAPTYSVHGNVMGKGAFEDWKKVCDLLGYEIDSTDSKIAIESNDRLNRSGEMQLDGTQKVKARAAGVYVPDESLSV